MDKISVLMTVVATLEAEIKSDREFLASDEAQSLSFEEEFATQNVISRLERLAEHFQDQIEAMINAHEISQGM
jgi:hypothetical protein